MKIGEILEGRYTRSYIGERKEGGRKVGDVASTHFVPDNRVVTVPFITRWKYKVDPSDLSMIHHRPLLLAIIPPVNLGAPAPAPILAPVPAIIPPVNLGAPAPAPILAPVPAIVPPVDLDVPAPAPILAPVPAIVPLVDLDVPAPAPILAPVEGLAVVAPRIPSELRFWMIYLVTVLSPLSAATVFFPGNDLARQISSVGTFILIASSLIFLIRGEEITRWSGEDLSSFQEMRRGFQDLVGDRVAANLLSTPLRKTLVAIVAIAALYLIGSRLFFPTP